VYFNFSRAAIILPCCQSVQCMRTIRTCNLTFAIVFLSRETDTSANSDVESLSLTVYFRYATAGDVNFSDIVGCDLDMLRHGGAYGRIKDGGDGNGCGRQKRLRTSFKHHQLRSMKAYFALNHNPDAKDLKELAQKTGLTKRVLQVLHSIVFTL